MRKPVYLICVEGDGNHNKVYNMKPIDDNTWTAEWGRYGASLSTKNYPMYEWDKKYNEKIRKGYEDVSGSKQELIEEVKPNGGTKYKPLTNLAVKAIVEKLQKMAKEAIDANYIIKANEVTQSMIDEAQYIIDEGLSEWVGKVGFSNTYIVEQFNNKLISLFRVLPRKMVNVKSNLAVTIDDFDKIISREQSLLDVMKGQVYKPDTSHKDEEGGNPEKTILEELGLIIEEGTAEDIRKVKSLMDANGSNSAFLFRKVWRVTNLETQKRFDEFVKDNNIKDTRLLFHGSRNENFWSILKVGMKLRPNAKITGKMFGYGCYYSPKCRKSVGYTSLTGSYWANGNSHTAYMALFDVAYGKPYNVYDFDSKFYDLDYDKLQRFCPGANNLHAHADRGMLKNDEIVVYKEEQMTIKYLIEIGN